MGVVRIWRKLQHMQWHQGARLAAALILADQAIGPLSGIPSSEAITVACIGALFAPIPVSRDDNQ